MKNFHLALCVILLFLIFSSCRKITGKGPVVTESRQTASFNGLELKIDADVFFTQDSVYKVELQAQENVLDEIETTVINNNLQIRFRHSNTRIHSNDGISIYVSGPDVRSLTVDGSGYLEATAPVTPANLGLYVNGSGNIRVNNATTTQVDANIDGSGHITVSSGNANTANVRISGSGLLDVAGIMVKDADASISGSGNIKVFATQNLHASISGSGSIIYKGNPAVTTHINGSGTVTHQ
ncbi:head GIN domain-containing protein [Niastella vici]|nr:head GIN domain-containing protein [Niastella vici]